MLPLLTLKMLIPRVHRNVYHLGVQPPYIGLTDRLLIHLDVRKRTERFKARL